MQALEDELKDEHLHTRLGERCKGIVGLGGQIRQRGREVATCRVRMYNAGWEAREGRRANYRWGKWGG